MFPAQKTTKINKQNFYLRLMYNKDTRKQTKRENNREIMEGQVEQHHVDNKNQRE